MLLQYIDKAQSVATRMNLGYIQKWNKILPPELRRLLRKVKQRLRKVYFPVLLSENRFIKRNT
jgi:hypothetical protein